MIDTLCLKYFEAAGAKTKQPVKKKCVWESKTYIIEYFKTSCGQEHFAELPLFGKCPYCRKEIEDEN